MVKITELLPKKRRFRGGVSLILQTFSQPVPLAIGYICRKRIWMKTVQEAERIVLDHAADWGEESVPLSEATGRVLREPLRADRDFPPFNRVAMDGVAIRHSQWQEGARVFPVEGIQGAGAKPLNLSNTFGCFEVMTGAVLPEQTDTIIPYEQLVIEGGFAKISDVDVRFGQNVHAKGLDRKAGEVIVEPGRLLTAAEIGVAATVGMSTIRVARLPHVAVIATGDELVPVSAVPLPHQIRMSNVHQISALLTPFRIPAQQMHLVDNREELARKLAACIEKYDVLLLSGGVSKGRFDFIPEVLHDLGTRWAIDRVRQRPGKPFWFGTVHSGKTVFAMPGNPVSTFACMHRYVLPWFRKSMGINPLPEEFARLSAGLTIAPRLTYFLQVGLRNVDGELLATPLQGKGSGDLANLVETDGFLELPEDRTDFQKGEVFRVYRFRPA